MTGALLDPATVRRLEARVAAFVTEHRLPGCSTGVVVDGSLVWVHGYGFADRATGRRPDERTLYRIASISKTFTATAVLQLRDRGLLRLDDPLVAHVPEAAAITNPFGPVTDVTLRRLLLHTAGLQGEHPVVDPRVERWLSIGAVVDDLPQTRVVIPPDSQVKYCNIGYQLLGAVVERVAGRAFTEHVAAAILEPLGLASTGFAPTGPLAARRAVGYDGRSHSDVLPVAKVFDSSCFEADGGLWSTVEDLARWIAFTLAPDDAVLARATREEMLRPWIVADPAAEELQGLCWYWTRHRDEYLVGHAGGLHGFMTRIVLSPADGVGAIALINGMGDASALALDLAAIALDEVRGRPLAQPGAPPTPPASGVEGLLGRYLEPNEQAIVLVEWRDGALWLGSDDAWNRLEATAEPDVWVVVGGRGAGEPVRFLRDAAGRIDAANVVGYPHDRV